MLNKQIHGCSIMSYKHLTTFEGEKIETLLDQGLLQRDMVKKLGRSSSSNSRGLNRNGGQHNYKAETTHERYQFQK